MEIYRTNEPDETSADERIVWLPITPTSDWPMKVAIYFRPDGTGSFDRFEEVEFSLSDEERESVDPFTSDDDVLLGIARRIFDEINPTLPLPYFDTNQLVDRPVEFVCGSQSDLEHITRSIFQSGIVKPYKAPQYEVTFYSYSTNEWYKDGIGPQYSKQKDVCALLKLVFEYNSFTGYYWEYNDGPFAAASSYSEQPQKISIVVPAPKPLEQQAARDNLISWLQGKLPQEDIRRIFRVR